MKFDAAILAKSRADLVVDEVQIVDPLAAGQVLVKIWSSGICGAQINEIDAVKGPDAFLPHLLGHEGVGEVLEVGAGVRSVNVGDTVVLHWMQGEGIQSSTPTYSWRGNRLNAGWVTTLSEYSVVSENRVTSIEAKIDQKYLPLFGCAATTAWGSLVNDANMRFGESVVVLGTGGVGLLTVEAARAGGANPIIAVDLHSSRAKAALDFGAQVALVADDENLEAQIRGTLGPRGAEIVIDTTGDSKMIALAYNLASHGGRAILVGVPHRRDPVTLDSLPLHFGMTLTGSKGGATSPSVDIQRLIDLASVGMYRVTSLPITEAALPDINDCLEAIRTGLPGRVVVRMNPA